MNSWTAAVPPQTIEKRSQVGLIRNPTNKPKGARIKGLKVQQWD